MPVEKSRRSSWFVSLLTLLVILQTATPVRAWETLGHRVIARLAELAELDTAENQANGGATCSTTLWAAQFEARSLEHA
jgi:hypothetical protein